MAVTTDSMTGIKDFFEKKLFRNLKNLLRPVYNLTVRKYRNSYAYWQKTHEKETVADMLPPESAKINFSILTILQSSDLRFFNETIESVLQQTSSNWHWTVIGIPEHTDLIIKQSRKLQDPRIKILPLASFDSIHVALDQTEAQYFGFLDQNDSLAPFAVEQVLSVIKKHPDVSVIYSDEDKLSAANKRYDPWFKPEFNIYSLRTENYLRHFLVIQKTIGDKVNWFGSVSTPHEIDWLQFALYLSENNLSIAHIPSVLYHTRIYTKDKEPQPVKRNLQAIQSHLERQKVRAEVSLNDSPDTYRIRYKISGNPFISIIILNKNHQAVLEACVSSILKKSTYRSFEIILVENGSDQEKLFDYYDQLKKNASFPGQILEWQEPFNYSSINNWAVGHCNGEILLFLNNDTEVITPNWLEEMIGLTQQPDAGAVGAKLLFPDRKLQHTGIAQGNFSTQFLFHLAEGLPQEKSGYRSFTQKLAPRLAVTGACMMIEKRKFQMVGGFDPVFPLTLNDVDLCLNLYSKGYTNLCTPYAELIHHESKTLGKDLSDEAIAVNKDRYEYFKQKWPRISDHPDPFISPNLNFDHFYQDRIQ